MGGKLRISGSIRDKARLVIKPNSIAADPNQTQTIHSSNEAHTPNNILDYGVQPTPRPGTRSIHSKTTYLKQKFQSKHKPTFRQSRDSFAFH